jgi:hypothetical protein
MMDRSVNTYNAKSCRCYLGARPGKEQRRPDVALGRPDPRIQGQDHPDITRRVCLLPCSCGPGLPVPQQRGDSNVNSDRAPGPSVPSVPRCTFPSSSTHIFCMRTKKIRCVNRGCLADEAAPTGRLLIRERASGRISTIDFRHYISFPFW